MKYVLKKLFNLLFTKSGRTLLALMVLFLVLFYTNTQAVVNFYNETTKVSFQSSDKALIGNILQMAYHFALNLIYFVFVDVNWSFMGIPLLGEFSMMYFIGLFIAYNIVRSFGGVILNLPRRIFSHVSMKLFNTMSNLLLELGQAIMQLVKNRLITILKFITEIDYQYWVWQIADDLKHLIDSIRRLFYRR